MPPFTTGRGFDTPPIFSHTEREQFFHVSESLAALLDILRTPANQVDLLLTVGYFRATKRFFRPPFPQADVVAGGACLLPRCCRLGVPRTCLSAHRLVLAGLFMGTVLKSP
jgi:hypothetical protein